MVNVDVALFNKDTEEQAFPFLLRSMYPDTSFPDTVFGIVALLSECEGTEPWAVWDAEITEIIDERSDV